MGQPTLALTMITAPDRHEEMARCLPTIAPYVDQCIVVVTGDVTLDMQTVLEEHKCEVYHIPWEQDFAKARNVALGYVTTDWWMWADSDDVIENAELLKEVITEQPPEVGGVWAPYHYSFDEYGNCSTYQERERLLRMADGWHWEGRLHETPVPHRSMHWNRTEKVRWLHLSDAGSRSERNLPILQQWSKEEPENLRVWLYLGNQYFADQHYLEAAKWYTRFFTHREAISLDKWSAMTYAARAWRAIGKPDEAIRADMMAMQLFPEWIDPYIGMAESEILRNRWPEAIEWGEVALKKQPPVGVVFSNPLDSTYNVYRVLQFAYGQANHLQWAIDACKLGLQVRPDDDELNKNLKLYEEALPKQKRLDAYETLAKNGNALKLAKELPEELRSHKQARALWVPALLTRTYRGTQPRIAFFCGPSLEEWDGSTPNTRGIGGSETAVVEVSKRFAEMGWQPVVYNLCGRGEGDHEGVIYADWQRFRPDRYHDALVSWRNPAVARERPEAGQKLLWMHDLNIEERLTPEFAAQYDQILGVSQWHADYLKKVYPFLDKVGFVPNGIDLARFEGKEHRNRFRCVYMSSPDRGLQNLLLMWPTIRKSLGDDAELHIFYGWESFARAAESGGSHYRQFAQHVKRLGQQPGVEWCGRLGQRELALELLAADAWLYPTSFLEVFCIAGLEAMAADLRIVTSACGNLPDLISDAGLCVPGHANTATYRRGFIGCAMGMLMDVSTRQEYTGRGPERAKGYTWNAAVEKWMALLGNGVREEAVCVS
jgi:glycosyltransferase involved in cell wall biosynthesis